MFFHILKNKDAKDFSLQKFLLYSETKNTPKLAYFLKIFVITGNIAKFKFFGKLYASFEFQKKIQYRE